MKHSIRTLAKAFVDLCSTLKEDDYAAASDAVLVKLTELGLGSAARRQFVKAVAKELKVSGAREMLHLSTVHGKSEAHGKKIATALEHALGTKVDLVEHAHKELIGGALLSFGDERFDASIHGALTQLTNQLAS
jgi:F0F1-type ATP synthase delta subunit